MHNEKLSLFALGDSAMVIQFNNVISLDVNERVMMLYDKLKSLELPHIKDIVPAFSSLTIHYDISLIKNEAGNDLTFFEILSKEVKQIIEKESIIRIEKYNKIKVPVCFNEKFAPDLNEISTKANLSRNKIIDIYLSKTYRVFMIGFLPGFPYMGEVDERIVMPRKMQPRNFVHSGSVGIAGKQTGIYPFNSPGGWQIIGRTPVKLFDKNSSSPSFFKPGDEVEFYSINENEFANY